MFAHRAHQGIGEDLQGAVSFGVHRCPSCKEPKEFVSWEESLRGPEHAECFDCGYRFGEVTTVVVDPTTGNPTLSRTPVLTATQVSEARRRLTREFARAMFQTDVPAFEAATSMPNVGQRGPQISNRDALIESMRRAGASEEQIANAYGTAET
jgi:Zn ribbon nucleic-acid-binding protein